MDSPTAKWWAGRKYSDLNLLTNSFPIILSITNRPEAEAAWFYLKLGQMN